MPDLANIDGQRVLIVRGAAGRDVLRDELQQRGAQVEYLDVYRRVPVKPTDAEVAALEERWQTDIAAVTLTSVEVLERLLEILTARGRELLSGTPYVAASERIADAARAHGLAGHCMLARADDDSITGALAHWHARAKL